MSKYLTVQGDMWDSICYRLYGTTACVDRLIQANLSLREYFIFPAGIEIVTPDFDQTETERNLPPWKEAAG